MWLDAQACSSELLRLLLLLSGAQKNRTALDKKVAGLVREYMNSNKQWQADYAKAYAKMMSAG